MTHYIDFTTHSLIVTCSWHCFWNITLALYNTVGEWREARKAAGRAVRRVLHKSRDKGKDDWTGKLHVRSEAGGQTQALS